jgi:hypothetical protein
MSVVLKLQKKCLDKNEDLESLLLEALVISTKLQLKDFKAWVYNELNGYEKDYPNYRNVYILPQIKACFTDWINPPIPKGAEELLSKRVLPDSVSVLEHMLLVKETGKFSINLIPLQKQTLLKLYPNAIDIRLVVIESEAYRILKKIRTVLLEWTLKLEEDNILGNDDLIFSEKEKEAAKSIHIENFNGVMGNVDNVSNMSTGANSTNVYNENNISNEIDKLITEVEKLGLQNQEQIIIDLENSKNDSEKAKSVLGSLLGRGAEVASISSAIIGTLSLLG